ncbi:hypothetical protein N7519_001709 [Penicillium mononematosum]|uniref:uncharacterized protein n=1 Tax=Penicillium mononematosum TaxID=268346 RepID=UPI0025497940|nr:uncharacterized protein N7519_001709 [Penicillium mononematosum]KAJ6191688.1 hypothetical protein N7519_001709 [Penicillium mononematosum]
MPDETMEPHIIHPVTMDACTQLFIVAIGDLIDQGTFAEIMLPRTLVGNNVNEPEAEINCHVVCKEISHNSIHHDMTGWSAGATMPEFRIWQYQTVLLERPAPKARHYQQPWTFMWKSDVSMMEPQGTTDYLRQACDKGARNREQNAKDLSNSLNKVVAILVHRALSSIQELRSPPPPHIERYLFWLQETRRRLPMDSGSLKKQDKLIQDGASTSVEGELMSCVASPLDSIINGEVDLFHLLSQDGLKPVVPAVQELLRAYGDICGHQTGGLKVLEVGSGDGASTKAFLPGLAGSMYTYTDISTTFFAKAQKTLAQWADSIDYRKFDITQDFQSKIWRRIHLTSYALQNLKSLLTKSGKLVLVEICKMDVLLPLVLGLHRGWWPSKEETRKAGPLQSATWWSKTLKASGFYKVELSIGDSATTTRSERTLMIAGVAGPGDDADQSSGIQAPPILVKPPQSSSQVNGIAEALSTSLAPPGNECTIVDILGVAHNAELRGKICIIIDIQGGLLSHMSNDLMANFRHLFNSCKEMLWVHGDDQSDPNAALITGLIRAVRWEQDFRQQNLVTLEIGHGHNPRKPFNVSREYINMNLKQ